MENFRVKKRIIYSRFEILSYAFRKLGTIEKKSEERSSERPNHNDLIIERDSG